jgi:hypothetical protein
MIADLEAAMTGLRSVADIEAALSNGMMYLNLHTEDQPSGEIRGQIYPAGNMGPDGPMIVAPMDGMTVALEGPADGEIMVMWNQTMDPEGNPVIYGWQFSTSNMFDDAETTDILSTGMDTTLTLSTADLISGLAELGVTSGGSIELFHRAFATDGSVGAYGPTATVTFDVGTLTIDDAIWQVDASDDSFFRADNNTRGGAYNPTTDHVVVISRSGGLRAVVLDATTGDSVGVLSTAGISGGTFPLSEIAITEDGQIFGANLTVNPVTSPAKVYRWADEFSEPELVFEGTSDTSILEGPRYGDGIGVSGTGTDAVVYLSGSGAQDRIAVLTSDDDNMLSLDDYLVPEAGQARARYGIAGIPGEDSVWVNSPTHALAKVSTVTGEIGREADPNVVFPTYGDLAYANEFVLTGPQFGVAERFALVDVSAEPFILATTPILGTAGNGNATGFAAFDQRNNALIVASSNNAIAAFPSPVDVTDMDLVNDTVPMAGEITSPADGATLTLEGADNTAFVAQWTEGTDAEGDDLSYRWQLSPTADFSGAILVDAVTGDATMFETTFGVVNAILENAGVEAGGTITVYHRVVAFDGYNYDASMPSAVTLTRGVITAEPGALLPTEFAVLGTAPNPARDRAVLRVDLPQTARVAVEVYDVMGRRVVSAPATDLGSGSARTLTLDLSSLASGTYVYRVRAEMGSSVEIRTGQLMVVR